MASFLKDVGKQVGKNIREGAVRGISKTVFGKGIIGGALGKAFQKKFGDKEEKDDRVSQALNEQITKEDQINATLAHMEGVVQNIADNIYNIAGVLNAQLTSMEESKRLQQERMSREASAAEEAASEQTTQITAPTAAGTQDTNTDKKGGIMGMISGLTSSVGGLKGILGKFGKKFAIVAAALAATGAFAYGLSDTGENGAPPGPTGEATPVPPSTTSTQEGTMGAYKSRGQAPEPTKVEAPPSSSPSSFMTDAMSSYGGEQGKQQAPFVGNIMGAMESGDIGSMMGAIQTHQQAFPQPAAPPPAPTPVAPPPSVAASAPPFGSDDADVAKLKDYFNRPENASDNTQLEELQGRIGTIKRAIRDTKSLISSATTPEEKARHESVLKDQLEPGLEATKKLKKAILDKARQSLGIKPAEGGGGSPPSAPSASSSSAAPSLAPSSGGEGGASPVPSAPSSGSSIGSASTSVAAASEPKPAENNTITASTNAPPQGSPAESSMPSPVADRGSLDAGTTFDSGR